MSDFFVHNKALIETNHIGSGSKIWAFVHVLPGAKIGKNATICDFCYIENEVEVGDNVTIKNGVYLWDGIKVENDVFIGPNAVFTNDLYPRSKNKKYVQQKTVLKQGCSIGANSTILAGVTIGMYAMIGAGAVVTKDVNNFELVYGNPAVARGHICVCTRKIVFKNNTSICECKRRYQKIDKEIILKDA